MKDQRIGGPVTLLCGTLPIEVEIAHRWPWMAVLRSRTEESTQRPQNASERWGMNTTTSARASRSRRVCRRRMKNSDTRPAQDSTLTKISTQRKISIIQHTPRDGARARSSAGGASRQCRVGQRPLRLRRVFLRRCAGRRRWSSGELVDIAISHGSRSAFEIRRSLHVRPTSASTSDAQCLRLPSHTGTSLAARPAGGVGAVLGVAHALGQVLRVGLVGRLPDRRR